MTQATHDEAAPFFEPFACIEAALTAARRRNKLAVRERLAGNSERAAEHQDYAHFYLTRVRMWRDMIEPNTTEGTPEWH